MLGLQEEERKQDACGWAWRFERFLALLDGREGKMMGMRERGGDGMLSFLPYTI